MAASQLVFFHFLTLACLRICSCSTETLILPLKTQKISSGSLLKPPKKLLFRHNVSLTVSLSVGNPPQPVSMVLDTGSELSWLRCNSSSPEPPCFDPRRSSSYSPILCSSVTCRTKTQNLTVHPSCDERKLCHVILSYADASSDEGNLASDEFAFGDSSAAPGTVFGCMGKTYSSTPAADALAGGLLGMNRGALSFVSQLAVPRFSYCISGGGSSSPGVLILGGAAAELPGASSNLSYTQLVEMPDPLPYFDRLAYSVQLEGIRVAAKLLSLPKSVFQPDHTGAGQTMVDTGTQFTFLLGPVYTALKGEYLRQTQGRLRPLNEPGFVFQGALDLCFLLPLGSAPPAGLPDVTLVLRGGAEVRVAGERLLYRAEGVTRGGDAVHCFTFGNSDLVPVEAYIIGHHHQMDMWVDFDLAGSQVGFSSARCEVAAQATRVTVFD